VSDWLERLGISDDPEEEVNELAPRVISASPQISSPDHFMNEKPKNFKVDIGYGIVKYTLALIEDKCITYIATLTRDGILTAVDKVEIYFLRADAKFVEERFKISLGPSPSPVIYNTAFVAPSMRKAKITGWAGDALIKYAGFRFF